MCLEVSYQSNVVGRDGQDRSHRHGGYGFLPNPSIPSLLSPRFLVGRWQVVASIPSPPSTIINSESSKCV